MRMEIIINIENLYDKCIKKHNIKNNDKIIFKYILTKEEFLEKYNNNLYDAINGIKYIDIQMENIKNERIRK